MSVRIGGVLAREAAARGLPASFRLAGSQTTSGGLVILTHQV